MFARYLLKICTTLLISTTTANVAASTPITFESTPNFLTSPGGPAYSQENFDFQGSSYFGVQSGLFITNNPGKYLVYFAGGNNTLTIKRSNN
ncbi:MAG TPA: hypothetical protein VL381_03505, partial [Rhodocyclaceae bacterium]|nr:hypothetical protein [Rhodocyclaceae bacterium]